MMNIKLQQQEKIPDKQRIDSYTNWIILLPAPLPSRMVKQLPYAEVLNARRKRINVNANENSTVIMDLPNKLGSHVAFGMVNKESSTFNLLSLGRKLVAAHKEFYAKEVGIIVHGFEAKLAEQIAETVIAALLAASAAMPQYKGRPRAGTLLNKICLYGVKASHAFKRTFAEAEGNALARNLSMLPSNLLTPTDYLKRIRQLASDNKWKLEFLDIKTLKKKKAGAFLAVAQGSPTDDAGIVRLVYQPQGKVVRKDKLTLVGKGICYDTGGTNLKPANFMFGMHEDMQGSAVALGTFLALSRLKVNFPVECWMALAMNHIGPKAYKPNDVVTASDGTTIEVVHTDAEGRMVLADTLALASKENPKLIIDYATLTGACVYSLGTAYSGVFTNQENIMPALIESGRDSGERVWPFPMDEDYDRMIESSIADIKQCSRESGVDHILASRFLQRFIGNKVKWIHVDLSSSNRKGGLAHIPTDTTGFGIRFTLNLLLDKKILQHV